MSARGSFRALTFLALALLGGISALAGYLGIPAGHLTIGLAGAAGWCAHLLHSAPWIEHAANPTEWLLTVLIGLMALAGLAAALRTTWVTRRAVRRLGAGRLPLGPRLTRLARQLDIDGRLQLCDSQRLYSYCHGLRRPEIHISRGLVEALGDAELLAVLAHERHHLRQADPLRAAVCSVLAAAAFPLPLVASLRAVHLLARELEADRAALAIAGRAALARALWVVLRHPDTLRLGRVAAIGAFEPEGARLAQLLQPDRCPAPRPTRRSLVSSLSIVVVFGMLVGAALANPAHARGAPGAMSAPALASSAPCMPPTAASRARIAAFDCALACSGSAWGIRSAGEAELDHARP